jgi:hypothetical protein
MSINIKALQAAIDRKKDINKEIDIINGELNKLDKKINIQISILNKEQNDVDKLENNSIDKLVFTILNNYEKKYDKEVSELESASLDYDRLLEDRRYYEDKLKDLTKEFESINVNNEDLLLAKRDKLRELANDPAISKKISSFTEEINNINSDVIEVNEAYSIGQQAVTRLNDIKRQLDSAEGWGLFDIMGGGMVSSLIKHERMNQAKTEINRLKKLLKSYENELADVDYAEHLDIEIDGFIAFTDIFMDNIFSDFSSLNSIKKAKIQVENTYNRVYDIQERLYKFKLELANRKKELTIEIDNLILNTDI